MKFFQFYEDLVLEDRGRPMDSERFDKLTSLFGKYLFDEFASKPAQLSRVPMYSELKKYAISKQGPGEDANDVDQLVLMLSPDADEKSNLIYDWLNTLPQLTAQKFMNSVSDMFPNIGEKKRYFEKPEGYQPSGRGRKRGSKNKPKTPIISRPPIVQEPVVVSEPVTSQEPEVDLDFTLTEPVSVEKGKRGRKPGLTPKTVDRISQNLYKVHTNMENQLSKMKSLMDDLIKRKDFFGKQ